MYRNAVLGILLWIVFFWASVESAAHALDQSYVFLNIEDSRVSGHVDLTAVDINMATGLS